MCARVGTKAGQKGLDMLMTLFDYLVLVSKDLEKEDLSFYFQYLTILYNENLPNFLSQRGHWRTKVFIYKLRHY